MKTFKVLSLLAMLISVSFTACFGKGEMKKLLYSYTT